MFVPRKLKMHLLGRRPFGRPWYQYFQMNDGFSNFVYVGDRGKLRTSILLRALDAFPFSHTDVVADIGSNASVFGQYILDRVSKIYAVEIDKKFHRQALFLKSLHEESKIQKKLVLLNKDINLCTTQLLESNIVFLSKVLYHQNLDNNQESLLNTILHPNLRGVIMQGHTTQGELGTLDFIEDFMRVNNFSVVYSEPHHEYPVVCGVKNI